MHGVFGGPVTHAVLSCEEVDWTPFDIVGIDHYWMEPLRDRYVARLDHAGCGDCLELEPDAVLPGSPRQGQIAAARRRSGAKALGSESEHSVDNLRELQRALPFEMVSPVLDDDLRAQLFLGDRPILPGHELVVIREYGRELPCASGDSPVIWLLRWQGRSRAHYLQPAPPRRVDPGNDSFLRITILKAIGPGPGPHRRQSDPDTSTADGLGTVEVWNEGGGAIHIHTHPTFGTWEVRGAILSKYLDLGEEGGTLGNPISGERDAPSGGGDRVSYFEHGRITFTAATATAAESFV